jgi:ubiquinone/menaquinone biosynthesis C-methylase UbiE
MDRVQDIDCFGFIWREKHLLNKAYKVLHCAPQFGIWKRMLQYKNLDYIPADKFMAGYDYYEGVQDVDLLDIPFDENHFDYIICNRVLEHIEEDIKAMEEMYRVLKPGATALLSVPIDFNLKETHESYTSREDRVTYYGQWDHVRMYAGDIKNRLEKIGFSVEMNRYSDQFTEEEMRKYGLCVDTIIVAKK